MSEDLQLLHAWKLFEKPGGIGIDSKGGILAS